MSLTTRKNLFFILLNLLFLLSFLLSETHVSLYVLGAFSLLLLIFRRTFPSKKEISFPVVVLTLSLLGLFALSLVSSISFPLSSYAFVRYTFLFAFFFFFLKTDFSLEEKKMIFKLLVLQGVSLVFVSMIFFLLPEYGNLIPGMNVIFSTYGHNHLGAIMLILSPIAFWLYLDEKKKLYLGIFLLFTFSMIMSFGRVVIFIGLIQLIVISYLYFQWYKIKLKDFSSVLLISLIVFFITSLVFYVYSGSYDVCLVENEKYQSQLCKTDLRENARHFYWEQGLQAFFDKPIFGYGLGTFGSVSYLYRQIPDFRSKYVHNDYLQFFAEGGVFAGLGFISLMALLYWGTWENLKKSQQILLLLSLVSIGIDIFFDFDFHFFGISLLIFFLFALNFQPPKKANQLMPTKNIEVILTIMLVGVLFASGLYLVTDQLVSKGEEDRAYDIYPFFHWHSEIFMNSEKIDLEQKKYLAKIYWASPNIQDIWVKSLEGEEKAIAERQSWLGNPWRKTNSFLIKYYFETENIEELESSLSEIKDFLDDKRIKYNFLKDNISHKNKSEWAQQFIFLAEREASKKNYAKSGQFLQNAYYFEEWSIANSDIDQLLEGMIQADYDSSMKDFLALLMDVPAINFGDSRNKLARIYFAQVLDLLRSGEDNQLLERSTQRVAELAEWNANFLSTLNDYPFLDDSAYSKQHNSSLRLEWFNSLQRYIDIQLEIGNEEEVGQLLDKLTKNIDGIYWVQAQRGYFYGLIGDNEKAKQAFEECLASNPDHEDCQHGLGNLVEKGYPDIQRYYEVRDIILDL